MSRVKAPVAVIASVATAAGLIAMYCHRRPAALTASDVANHMLAQLAAMDPLLDRRDAEDALILKDGSR